MRSTHPAQPRSLRGIHTKHINHEHMASLMTIRNGAFFLIPTTNTKIIVDLLK